MNFKCDLILDAEGFYSAYLKQKGVVLKHGNDAILDYFIYSLRIPVAKSRKVLKTAGFVCPQGYEEKLKYIENAITTGKDLSPFMTKNTRDLNKEDLLLNDWGIYHLHLSDEMQNGYIERSSFLLLALISDENVYFIECIPHPTSGDLLPWGLVEYLEIIDSNWPEYIDRWRISTGSSQLLEHFTEKEYLDLRMKGCNVSIELQSGKVIFGPGGGVTCDFSPTESVLKSNSLKRELIGIPTILNRFIVLGALEFEVGLSEVALKLVGIKPFLEYQILVDNSVCIGLYKIGNQFKLKRI